MGSMNVNAWKIEIVKGRASLRPLELSASLDTFNQVSQNLPGGAYTTLRTYEGDRFLRLEAHFHRLERTAQLIGMPVSLNRVALREALHQVVVHFPPGGEVRLRLTLDLEEHPGRVYIMAERLQVPPFTAYQFGVKAVTCQVQRQFPQAKRTKFIQKSERVRKQLPPSVNEAIMVGADDHLLEGLSSNFFAVKKGEIWTADEGALAGTTRALVLELIAQLELSLHLQGVRLSVVPDVEEAFITSASRGVLPVIQIDQVVIGSGLPGEITRRLMARYQEFIGAEAETL